MLRAFQEAVGDSWKSTVRVVSEGKQLSLGAIVHPDGWIATKASELPSTADVYCRLWDNTKHLAERVTTVVDLDLALLKIPVSELRPVEWEKNLNPVRGRWLATTDIKAGVPSAVGVVSAGLQRVYKSRAVLGVNLTDSREGAAITVVLLGSGAEEAGLRPGDSIFEVNGTPIASRAEFLDAIKEVRGGQRVMLSVNRADKTFKVEARLMDLAEELLDETEMEVNGHVSARATDFESVFMHDTVLEPNQCGGPLVDLNGKVVGLNIARAGRVSTYALPADVVVPVVNSLIEQSRLVSRPSQSSLRPIR